MTLQRIDFFTFSAGQQYGVQQAFSAELQKALSRLNVAGSLYPFEELGAGTVIKELVTNTPDCTAGFNVIVREHSLIEPLGLPHLSIIVDAAHYFPELIRAKNSIAAFVDEDSLGLYRVLGGKNGFFFPHAIERELLCAENHERDLDIVMLGSFIDPEEVLSIWTALLSKKSVDTIVQLCEKVLASDHLSHIRAFVELVEEKGEFEQELIAKSLDYFDILNTIDRYIRAVDRKRIVDAIERPIHLFGKEKYKNTIFHGEVPFIEMPKVLSRARIVINSFPMFKRGLHERLLSSLACGASVLANDTFFLQETFGRNRLALLNYSNVNEQIEKALGDEEARFKAVVATHDVIRREHTWDERAKQLVEVLPGFIKRVQAEIREGLL